MSAAGAPSLSARSVVASTLLGTTPPQLPSHLLVAFAEEFGIKPGTTRVALSRMLERGELRRVDDASYALAGDLIERQERQERGLAPVVVEWTGDWEIAVVRGGKRPSSERQALRRAALHLGLRERRDGTWMRPANLDPQRLPGSRRVLSDQADHFIGRPTDRDPANLVAELFDLAPWADEARSLIARMADLAPELASTATPPLARGFELAAAALRHQVADPLLPAALMPEGWPGPALRAGYAAYNVAYRERLSAFFRSRSRVAG